MVNLPVPVPRTFSVSETETGSYLNTVRDALNFLLNPPMAVMTQGVAQTLTNNTAAAITFDATTVDTYGGHSNVTNNSRYTAQVAGWYWVRGQVAWAASATNDRSVQINKNGVQVSTNWNVAPSAGAAFAPGRETSGLIFLNVGDYVEIFALQNTGGNLNTFAGSVTSSMQVLWVHS